MGEWDWTAPMIVDDQDVILAGHGRQLAGLKKYGPDYKVPVSVAIGWTEEQKRAYIIADNRLTELGTWDQTLLQAELTALDMSGFSLELTGFSLAVFGDGPALDAAKATLAAKFMLPPFSVLSARDGWWQARKQAWIALGIQSELGRGANALDMSDAANAQMTGGDAYKSADGKRAGRHKANATPGGSMRLLDRQRAARKASPGGGQMPATNYSKSGKRGDSRGRPTGPAKET